jgi:radical SAM protein with 4Fe4S-binding SPASM domain
MSPQATAAQPFLWQVELTNFCPHRCIGCPLPTSRRPVGFMSEATFEACIAAVRVTQKHARPMGLHHFGESLLHPDLVRFVRFASDADVPTQLACNPDQLAPETAEGLLSAGLYRIVFSLDAMDVATLRRIRGPAADFERGAASIEAFLAAKARLGSPCQVRIQMVGYRENEPQREEFLRRWSRPGVYAYVKRFDSWARPEMAALGSTPMEHRCSFPFESAVVLWNGVIVPCCHDADGEVPLGDIHDGLLQAWNNELYRRFRIDFLRGTLPDGHLCQRCAWLPTASAREAP